MQYDPLASHPADVRKAAQDALTRAERDHGPMTTGGKQRFLERRCQQERRHAHLHVLEHIAGRMLTKVGNDAVDFTEIHCESLLLFLDQAHVAGRGAGQQAGRDAALQRATPVPASINDHTNVARIRAVGAAAANPLSHTHSIAEAGQSHAMPTEPSNSHTIAEADEPATTKLLRRIADAGGRITIHPTDMTSPADLAPINALAHAKMIRASPSLADSALILTMQPPGWDFLKRNMVEESVAPSEPEKPPYAPIADIERLMAGLRAISLAAGSIRPLTDDVVRLMQMAERLLEGGTHEGA